MLKAATNRARIVQNALRRIVLNRTKRARGTMAGNRLNNIVRYYIEKKTVPPPTLSSQLRKYKAGMKARNNAALHSLSNNLNSKNFFKGVPIAKIGSQSANGAIFAMQMNNGSRKVLKIIHHPLGQSEYSFQQNASKYNISPKVYKLKLGITLTPFGLKSFFTTDPPNNKINAFLMNNLQKNAGNKIMSLHDFFGSASNTNKTIIYNKLTAKVKKLSNLGIEHADLHALNAYVIMKAGGTLDVMIIDYGRSKRTGVQTRSFASGKVGQRFGNNASANYPGFGPIYQRKKNNLPVILSRNKLAKMKTNYKII
jgi:hypothetical protein